jgi:AhpC/TSA family
MKNTITIFFLLLSYSVNGQGMSSSIELLNVVDGKTTAIKACADCKGVVVIFTSLVCAYDQHYRERIKALVEKYSGSISFFLINANPGSEESEIKMKEAYQTWGLTIPFLSDKKQTAMTMLNVKRTPEAVLLKSENGTLKTIYQGAIDDNPQVHHDTGVNFLDDAIGALISGKPIKVAAERAIGCTIRKGG